MSDALRECRVISLSPAFIFPTFAIPPSLPVLIAIPVSILLAVPILAPLPIPSPAFSAFAILLLAVGRVFVISIPPGLLS